MITILYPEKDYTAADLALKTQALAQNAGNKIYIVPRHYGRQEINVQKNLEKTKIALLIIHDAKLLDDSISSELNFLISKNIKIYALIPQGVQLGLELEQYSHAKIQRYSGKGQDELIDEMQKLIKGIQQDVKGEGFDSNSSDWGVFIATLLLVLALISLVINSTSKKVK